MDHVATLLTELQAIKAKTTQLESAVHLQLNELMDLFEVSFPSLKLVERVRMDPEDLATWLRTERNS